jgi:hypothetical protein
MITLSGFLLSVIPLSDGHYNIFAVFWFCQSAKKHISFKNSNSLHKWFERKYKSQKSSSFFLIKISITSIAMQENQLAKSTKPFLPKK